MLTGTVSEILSLGATLPFLAALSDPKSVFSYQAIDFILKLFEITTPDKILMPLCILFACLAVFAGCMRVLILSINSRFTSICGSELSVEVYTKNLYRPYHEHIEKNSSEIISNISHVNGVVFGVLLPLLYLINSVFLLMALVITLFLINAYIATVSMLFFGISYFAIAWFTRKRLLSNSDIISKQQSKSIQIVQESIGGIRDVKLEGTEAFYSELFKKVDLPLRTAQADNSFIGMCPRAIMETSALVLVAVLAFLLVQSSGNINNSLPILGTLAVGAQRLLPTLQQIYSSWTSIVGNSKQLEGVINLIELPNNKEIDVNKLNFKKSIDLKNLSFSYPSNKKIVLSDINLKIKKGSKVGFTGATGSGKSTLIDLIMGLLPQSSGCMLVDDMELSGTNLKSWQKIVAHVPQNIFLADSTFAENIAFAVPLNLIDMDRVKTAAKKACIADFIENTQHQYYTRVGERGAMLSGGQRQRIAIARALYKDASVLILDEATSALDAETEHNVMESIYSDTRNLTVLIIAHRLETLEHCDTIVNVKNRTITISKS